MDGAIHAGRIQMKSRSVRRPTNRATTPKPGRPTPLVSGITGNAGRVTSATSPVTCPRIPYPRPRPRTLRESRTHVNSVSHLDLPVVSPHFDAAQRWTPGRIRGTSARNEDPPRRGGVRLAGVGYIRHAPSSPGCAMSAERAHNRASGPLVAAATQEAEHFAPPSPSARAEYRIQHSHRFRCHDDRICVRPFGGLGYRSAGGSDRLLPVTPDLGT
jgi:hypothetical protein